MKKYGLSCCECTDGVLVVVVVVVAGEEGSPITVFPVDSKGRTVKYPHRQREHTRGHMFSCCPTHTHTHTPIPTHTHTHTSPLALREAHRGRGKHQGVSPLLQTNSIQSSLSAVLMPLVARACVCVCVCRGSCGTERGRREGI